MLGSGAIADGYIMVSILAAGDLEGGGKGAISFDSSCSYIGGIILDGYCFPGGISGTTDGDLRPDVTASEVEVNSSRGNGELYSG